MENSYRFFENRACKYYPCHENIKELNCLFCYCPLYHKEACPGNYSYTEINGTPVKECTECTFPHQPENYELIIKLLEQ